MIHSIGEVVVHSKRFAREVACPSVTRQCWCDSHTFWQLGPEVDGALAVYDAAADAAKGAEGIQHCLPAYSEACLLPEQHMLHPAAYVPDNR